MLSFTKAIIPLLLTLLFSMMVIPSSKGQELVTRVTVEDTLHDVEFSPDGELLAVAADSGVYVFNDSLEQIAHLEGYPGAVLTVSWSPDGNRLAGTSSDESTTLIWQRRPNNVFTLDAELRFDTSFMWGYAAAWSPDSSRLATMRLRSIRMEPREAVVLIWETTTWQLQRELIHHYLDPSRSLAWSPDSQLIAGAGEDYCLDELVEELCTNLNLIAYVADATTGGRIWTAFIPDDAQSIVWVSDLVVFSYSGYMLAYNSETGEEVARSYSNSNDNLIFIPNKNVILAVGFETDTPIEVVNPQTLEVLTSFVLPTQLDLFWDADWNNDGLLVLMEVTGEIELHDIGDFIDLLPDLP
jgi:WD40 repeat protein